MERRFFANVSALIGETLDEHLRSVGYVLPLDAKAPKGVFEYAHFLPRIP